MDYSKARILAMSTDYKKLEHFCNEIKRLANRFNAKLSGPVPLPTKRMRVHIRKGPDGGGTSTIDHWEMRVHKRLIDLHLDTSAGERALRIASKLPITDGVNVSVTLK